MRFVWSWQMQYLPVHNKPLPCFRMRTYLFISNGQDAARIERGYHY